jgi:hypothetical protein
MTEGSAVARADTTAAPEDAGSVTEDPRPRFRDLPERVRPEQVVETSAVDPPPSEGTEHERALRAALGAGG